MIPTPAFQFYWSEFIHGTAAMTPEEVGGYIRLLCHQWDAGFVPNDDKAIGAITRCGGDAIASIRHKFGICEDGTLRNARLEKVRADQVEYRRKQSENAKKGWNSSGGNARKMPRHSQRSATAHAKPMPNGCSLTSSSPKGEEVSTEKRLMREEEAEAIYKLYPRKVGKPQAIKALLSVLAKTPAQKIITCLEGWVKNWELTGTEMKYIPFPATWINRKPWEEEESAPEPNPQPEPEEFVYVAPPVPNREHYMRILRGEPDPDADKIVYIDQPID